MTDLLHILPEFPTRPYTHLIPSLEKHLITTTDLLTLDAVEVARRAQLPVLDVRQLAKHIIALLQGQLGLELDDETNHLTLSARDVRIDAASEHSLGQTGKELAAKWNSISTLDESIDAALGGGIPTGYISEIAGESGAGKTQLLLTLLLSAQLPPPHGVSRPAIYISTEHSLPTTRLTQLLETNPLLVSSSSLRPDDRPSLSRILTLSTRDLESQDHILTYQLPVALARHNIGLVVIDSIAANFRTESLSFDAAAKSPSTPRNHPAALAERSTALSRLGSLLRSLARKHNCAIVIANQVADRFGPLPPPPQNARSLSSSNINASSYSPLISTAHKFDNLHPSSSPTPGVLLDPPSSLGSISSQQPPSGLPNLVSSQRQEKQRWWPLAHPFNSLDEDATAFDGVLTYDHQQRFFTGWGDSPEDVNLKTPSLGLVWTNQIACRIVLVKEFAYISRKYHPPAAIQQQQQHSSSSSRSLRVLQGQSGPKGDGEGGSKSCGRRGWRVRGRGRGALSLRSGLAA